MRAIAIPEFPTCGWGAGRRWDATLLAWLAALAWALAAPGASATASGADPAAAARSLAAAAEPGNAREAHDEQADRDYWRERNRGWFFYEAPPRPVPHKPPPRPTQVVPAAAPAVAPKHPDLQRFEALQRRVEETRNIAIINPTEANMLAHLAAQKEAIDISERFAKLSTRVAWSNAEFDPSASGGRPWSANGMHAWDAIERQRYAANWDRIRDTHALFFFFRGDCPYCHAFAPQLRELQRRTGVMIQAVSMDGTRMPGFRNATNDNGISKRFGVQQVPALFLVEPRQKTVMPVGYGVIAPIELEYRIDQLLNGSSAYLGETTQRPLAEAPSQ